MKMTPYEQYEKQCKKMRKANERLLNVFEEWLKSAGLSEKTIDRHLSNADFYINEFLLYEDVVEAKDGAYRVDDYLGDWFIRKGPCGGPSSLKSSAASLKKFFAFLHEKGLVDKEDLTDLIKTIKAEMPKWLQTSGRYYDSSIDDIW